MIYKEKEESEIVLVTETTHITDCVKFKRFSDDNTEYIDTEYIGIPINKNNGEYNDNDAEKFLNYMSEFSFAKLLLLAYNKTNDSKVKSLINETIILEKKN